MTPSPRLKLTPCRTINAVPLPERLDGMSNPREEKPEFTKAYSSVW